MKTYRVTENYEVCYPNPIILKKGDVVTIEKWETNPEWLGWAFCVDTRGIKGWVSEKYLKVDGSSAIATADYEATELGVIAGEMVKSHKEEFGWAWVENSQRAQGWVPMKVLTPQPRRTAGSQRQIHLFDIPSNAGCLEFGTEMSPTHFRKCGLIQSLERSSVKVLDLGEVPIPELERHNRPPVRNYPSPKIVWEETQTFIANQGPLGENGVFLCLGGDCSIVVGTLAGMAQIYDPELIHVLYIDGDTDSTVPDPNRCVGSAGMGLHFLTSASDYWNGRLLSPSQITVIGNKETPPSDFAIPTISLERLRAEGITRSLNAVLSEVPTNRKLFIHFDMDVLSQSEMPAAYSPREAGLSFAEAAELLALILGDSRVNFLEVTEFSPPKDPEGKSGEAIVKMLSRVLGSRETARIQ